MRVCMILEGCYPYVTGGVSSWMHQYIQAMPNVEFALWCIGANAADKGKFKYELPPNVVEVQEVFLDDALALKLNKNERKKLSLTKKEKEAFTGLFSGKCLDWDVLFKLFHVKKINPVSVLMSEEFLQILLDICERDYPYVSFADFFHTIRSMVLPELYLMTTTVPRADIYHSTATGYSGILGSLGGWKYQVPFILTEHGIYTREREEELLRAGWVSSVFRQQWIDLFYSFSDCAYSHAFKVTSLFSGASNIQKDLGCSPEKLSVIENGIHYERFSKIPLKKDDGYVDIGAVVRIAPIKDIKTMLYAFSELKVYMKNARLHIMGNVDDPDYHKECLKMIEQLQIEDVIYTGVVNVIEYMEKIDFTILTSISEGQPLAVLESMAAGRPCVTTDVGCCKELIYANDEFGDAGIVVPPMHKDRLATAMLRLCKNKEERLSMGQNAKQRAGKYFTHEISMDKYKKLYEEVVSSWQG